jgi:Tol biopolymer transport system component
VVVSAGDGNARPIWTRDGSRLVFLSKRSGTSGLWSIPVRNGKANGTAELVRPNMSDVQPLGFTNTGTFLYIQAVANQNVFVEALDPAKGKSEGSPDKAVNAYIGANTNPSWSPDGKSIAYISRRSEPSNQSSTATLVIRSIETGQEKTISTLFRNAGQPNWFPDGQSILQTGRNAQNVTCFYKVDLRTGVVQELVNTGSGMPQYSALSADGKTVYTRHPEKFNMIAAFDLASGRRTDIILPGVEISQTITASPDGRKLAYAARAATVPHLYVTNTDGTDAHDLFATHPQTGFITGIAWTHDSHWLYYAIGDSGSIRGHTSQLWRVAVNGGTPEPTGLSASTVGAIALNPNDTRLVFGGGELTKSEYWALDNLDRTWKR